MEAWYLESLIHTSDGFIPNRARCSIPNAGRAVQHQDCTQSFCAQLQVSWLVSIVRRSCIKDTKRPFPYSCGPTTIYERSFCVFYTTAPDDRHQSWNLKLRTETLCAILVFFTPINGLTMVWLRDKFVAFCHILMLSHLPTSSHLSQALRLTASEKKKKTAAFSPVCSVVSTKKWIMIHLSIESCTFTWPRLALKRKAYLVTIHIDKNVPFESSEWSGV